MTPQASPVIKLPSPGRRVAIPAVARKNGATGGPAYLKSQFNAAIGRGAERWKAEHFGIMLAGQVIDAAEN